MLPALITTAETRRDRTAQMLTAAAVTALGQEFTVGGQVLHPGRALFEGAEAAAGR